MSDDKTEKAPPDRRGGDRREGSDPGYTGPERRKHDRRQVEE